MVSTSYQSRKISSISYLFQPREDILYDTDFFLIFFFLLSKTHYPKCQNKLYIYTIYTCLTLS